MSETEPSQDPAKQPLPAEPSPDEDREAPSPGAGALARRTTCQHCHAEVFSARCDDGKWRTFGLEDHDSDHEGVWVWHKRHGMQEWARFGRPARPGDTLVPGKLLHYCAEYTIAKMHVDIPREGRPAGSSRPRGGQSNPF
jgi:hypothetical protein